ncbi:MAG: N-acetylmuramoyl-L-alanine amidase [Lachnospiraceae bacterium]|nr:N-acetylmuramoyl-L-alanine amidase [Lachnospiraceae bacterium]
MKRIRIIRLILAAVFLFILWPPKVNAYENIVVVIDPGHGGPGTEGETDSGAKYNGVEEKDVDLITAQALYDELSQYGNLTVYMTRTEDAHMDLQERVDFAKSVGANVLISVHYNASAHHRFYGSEIFTSAFDEHYAKGYSLAQTIMSWWVEDGRVSKGIKTRIGRNGDYYGLIRMGREAGIPTIILEHGYLDNDVDFSKLNTRAAWEHMGQLDATAIADYYGAKKGVVGADVAGELTVAVPSDRMDDDTTPPTDVKVTVDSYDPESGLLTYTVSAKEPEPRSMLMYYDIDTQESAADEEKGFMHLNVWESGADSVQGAYTVPQGYRGRFVVRVYNNYEKFTDTLPFEIPAEMLGDPDKTSEGAGATENGVSLQAPGQKGTGTEMPNVTLQDENGATWTLEGALKDAKGFGFVTGREGKENNRYYIGFIAAIVVAGLMLIAAIVMAIVTGRRGKRRRR